VNAEMRTIGLEQYITPYTPCGGGGRGDEDPQGYRRVGGKYSGRLTIPRYALDDIALCLGEGTSLPLHMITSSIVHPTSPLIRAITSFLHPTVPLTYLSVLILQYLFCTFFWPG
jgi:hypothetical protein